MKWKQIPVPLPCDNGICVLYDFIKKEQQGYHTPYHQPSLLVFFPIETGKKDDGNSRENEGKDVRKRKERMAIPVRDGIFRSKIRIHEQRIHQSDYIANHNFVKS